MVTMADILIGVFAAGAIAFVVVMILDGIGKLGGRRNR